MPLRFCGYGNRDLVCGSLELLKRKNRLGRPVAAEDIADAAVFWQPMPMYQPDKRSWWMAVWLPWDRALNGLCCFKAFQNLYLAL